MQITVKVFATLRKQIPSEQQIELPDSSTANDLLQRFKLPENSVSIIMVNGKRTSFDTLLKHNDIIALFPPVGGG